MGMASNYDYVKKWRSKKKNLKKSVDYMRRKRREYKEMYDAGKIAYEDIPKGYRYFVPKKNNGDA